MPGPVSVASEVNAMGQEALMAYVHERMAKRTLLKVVIALNMDAASKNEKKRREALAALKRIGFG